MLAKETDSRYHTYFQKYRMTPKGKFNIYKGDAKRRGIVMQLTFAQFQEIISKPCTYCGESSSLIGVDRTNNALGYIDGNCTPCCRYCNYMKKDMSEDNFLQHIVKISEHIL